MVLGGPPPGPYCSDANGTPGRPIAIEMADTVIPTSFFGTLIGNINGTYFPIGSPATITMPAAGTLILLMNDRTCCYYDNSGSISVTVTQTPPPISTITVTPAQLQFSAVLGGNAPGPQTVAVTAASPAHRRLHRLHPIHLRRQDNEYSRSSFRAGPRRSAKAQHRRCDV
jgi:hypothetical protein